MSIFEEFMRGRQFAQQQALNQLKLQQTQQLFPIEQQLKQLQIERERQGIAAAQQKQEQLGIDQQREQTVLLGSLAEQAMSINDPEIRNTFIMGAAQKAGVPLEDASQVTDEQLMQLVAAKQALQPSQSQSKFGRVFQAKDDQGNPVFAQADNQGNIRVVEGLTPPDIQQQRIDLQREIAEGKAQREEKKFEADSEKVKKEQQADVNALSNTLSQIDSLINDPDFSGAVGLIDQFTGKIGAALGSKEGVVNRRATRVLNNSIVKIAKSLGANPTDRDMKILADTQPKLSDPPPVWQDWYRNDLIPTVNARLKAFGQSEIEPMTPESGKVRRLKYNPDTGQFE